MWAIKCLQGYLRGTKVRLGTTKPWKLSDHSARVQRWLEYLPAFDYTLQYRKGSALGVADFFSRLPQPATEHDRSGSRRLTPIDDETINLFQGLWPTHHLHTGPWHWLG